MKHQAVGMLLPTLAILLSVGCGSNKNEKKETMASPVAATEGEVRALAFPEVPQSITDPEERVAYAAAHFWDALDPSNHSESLDSAFMEQTFSNYTALLPYATEETLSRSVKAFADRCSEDPAVYDLAVYVARHYLDDPNSPMRNEELYIPFLKRFSTDEKLSEEKRTRAAFRLEQAMKNRPGTRASDFRMVTRDGRTTTLLSEVKDTTLIYFYDFDCEHCKETTERLSNPATGLRYPVIAVEVTEDRDGWDNTKSGMPGNWMVAFATEGIDGETYYFPALPSAYLLAPDGTVVLKDAGL